MARVNYKGYVERKVFGSQRKIKRNREESKHWRDWWLVKDKGDGYGQIIFRSLSLGKRYVGKRIRLKVEVLDE